MDQKQKTRFRNSKKWKDFRTKKRKEQKTDPVTGNKLCRQANLHHLCLDENRYDDISNEDNFVFLGNFTHKVLHWLGGNTKWDSKKWQKRLAELRKLCELMDELNGK
ncbi:MAG: hypothetical protein MJZ37_06990 [Bacilli bacterium]|nr:hypothetical protein [Bacilli bacterium]